MEELTDIQVKELKQLYNTEIDEIELIIDNAYENWLSGKIDKKEYNRRYKFWNPKLHEAHNKLDSIHRKYPFI